MNECRSCSAPITWLNTLRGRPMPVDGTVAIVDGKLPMFDHKVHISHFATCPNANTHRKGKPK